MKKLLVIAYYWPPAGGPGVQRWLKFVKYLPEFGYQPVVYVPENAHYPIIDRSLVNEIPENIQIIKRPISEPYRWARFLSPKKTRQISSGIITEYHKQSFLERGLLWIRGNLFIPDARKSWVKPSVAHLTEYIEKEKIEYVITTGPPHSVHLIGLQLKQRFKELQWITDFRDPWTTIGYHKKLKLTKASQQKHKALESEVLNSCDKVIVTSRTTKKEFSSITNAPIKVITNGFEPEKLQVSLDEAFTLSHIGSLLTDRNPEMLWKVLSELIGEHLGFAEHLKIQLIGVVGERVLESLSHYGLGPYVDHLGYLSHHEVQQYQQQSQVLLLAEIDSTDTRGIIPGKLFEYLAAERPILAIGPKGWEAGELVKSAQAGAYFYPSTENGLKKLLLDWFNDYQQQELKVVPNNIEQFSRRALTKTLGEYIEWELS